MKGDTIMSEYGVITEQGDLGLGFNPLSQKDQKVVNEAVQRERELKQNSQKKPQIINESK
jgi:hypothetical protein